MRIVVPIVSRRLVLWIAAAAKVAGNMTPSASAPGASISAFGQSAQLFNEQRLQHPRICPSVQGEIDAAEVCLRSWLPLINSPGEWLITILEAT